MDYKFLTKYNNFGIWGLFRAELIPELEWKSYKDLNVDAECMTLLFDIEFIIFNLRLSEPELIVNKLRNYYNYYE